MLFLFVIDVAVVINIVDAVTTVTVVGAVVMVTHVVCVNSGAGCREE